MSPLSKDQALKIGKAALYVAISAGISFLISVETNSPALFGVYTPIINVVLVTVKQLFTESK